MPLQPSPLLRGFEQGADGTDTWNDLAPGGARGPLTLDPQGVALGQQLQAIKAGIEAQQARPVWNPDNPVGTETVQSMGMPQPTTYAGPVGQFIDPATGRMTEQGAARMDNPMLGVDTGGIGMIKAFHGSPHKFDQFSDHAIGTGEGAQAYGYGHYVAENEGVARGYRDALTRDSGAVTYQTPYRDARLDNSSKTYERFLADRFRANGGDVDATAAHLERDLEANPGDPTITKALELARAPGSALTLKDTNPGHMYEVNVAADPEKFLHWDKPLSEQHPDVRDAAHAALMKSGIDRTMANYIVNNKTGRDLHSTLARGEYRPDLMAPEAGAPGAAQALKEAGIPGIRYLDAGSRGAGEGSHNVVVFDPKNMEIIRRYGLAGLMGGGVAALAGGGTQEQ
jgi:hypothetical protein